MASLFKQLATILLLAITIQTSVASVLHDYYDYEENEESSLGNLLNSLNMVNLRPQLASSTGSDENFVEVESPEFEDVEDDDRQARSYGSHSHDMQEHYCMVVTRHEALSDSNFEYRPSFQEDKFCQPVIGDLNHNQKGLCYVRGKGCQTVYREKSFFKRQRHSTNCWRPEIRNVSDGCKCYFERHNLRGKSYTG